MTFKNLFPHLYENSKKSEVFENFCKKNDEKKSPQVPIQDIFKLPITYTKTYPITETVAADLELLNVPISVSTTIDVSANTTEPIYHSFFMESHKNEFATKIIPKWIESGFTDDIEYLCDTQSILRCDKGIRCEQASTVEAEKVLQIWSDIKEDSTFLEKYGYMDWKFIEKLNHSSTFLDVLCIYNISSPLLSLLLPIFILIVPFFIFKIRQIPITFSTYLEIMRDIAKNHFLGKTLNQMMSNMTLQNFAYLVVYIFIYVMQIYQNIVYCMRFFRNMKNMRESLHVYKDFAQNQILHMENWRENILPMCHCSAYKQFSAEIEKHCSVLRQFCEELNGISQINGGTSIFVGNMMRCFYLLHKNEEYEISLKYAMGFEGYLNCLEGIQENIRRGYVSFGTFGEFETDTEETLFVDSSGVEMEENTEATAELVMKQIYHPILKHDSPVKNDVIFKNNFIITGPNASGKTTILKATILNVLFMQQFGCGFFDSCRMKQPYTHLHSYLNIPDTNARESLFQAESARCKQMIDSIHDSIKSAAASQTTPRHFCIFDELFSGTNPTESTKTAQSFLLYLARRKENVTFMMTTHYTEICEFMKKRKAAVENYCMKTKEMSNTEIKFLYVFEPGISRVQGAVKVLRAMKFPEEILIECTGVGEPKFSIASSSTDEISIVSNESCNCS